MGNMNFQIFVDGLEINSGNSGGPLWVEDRGLVGVLTGKEGRTVYSGHDNFLVYSSASFPGANGQDYAPFADQRVIEKWAGVSDGYPRVSSAPTRPAPPRSSDAPEPPAPDSNPDTTPHQPSDGGSSDLSPEEIWGIVGGVISLISVLVGLARQFGVIR